MRNPTPPSAGDSGSPARLPLFGWVAVIASVILVSVPGYCFTILILLLGLFGGFVSLGLALLAMLCFLSVIGTILCAFGIIRRASVFKWLLMVLSILGMLSLPVAAFCGVADWQSLVLFAVLAGWSALLFVAALFAFSYISRMGRRHESDEVLNEL